MITIVVKEPGKEAYSKEIEDNLEEYQKIVGGYIETVPFDIKQVLVCNEEGKLEELESNLLVPGDLIVGTVIVVGTTGAEFRSLLPTEIEKAIERLNGYAVEA